ncbi:hypothetical protein OS493_017713 [Desmophyllum pertusum]|uniref:Uncharacterized protein n=1 Tax=Desmophyllum pertusum TaxID=174260 RepID=A0A9W9ZFJ8_9CNID|nr:hypothetical protein OS493_017713 [Desmophyllum pertusum]
MMFTRGVTSIRYGRRVIRKKYPIQIRVGRRWKPVRRYRRKFSILVRRKRRILNFYRGKPRLRIGKRWKTITRRKYRGKRARRRRRRVKRRRKRRRRKRRTRRRRRRTRRRKKRRVRRRRIRKRKRRQRRRRRNCVLRFKFNRRWRNLVRRGTRLTFRIKRTVGYVRFYGRKATVSYLRRRYVLKTTRRRFQVRVGRVWRSLRTFSRRGVGVRYRKKTRPVKIRKGRVCVPLEKTMANATKKKKEFQTKKEQIKA